MNTGSVNSFLDRFLGLADRGFGLIQGDVAFVLNALIVISVTLAGAMWALKAEAPIAPFFRKVLFVGLFAFLVNNWNAVAGAINQSGAALGLKAGGSGMSLAQLHDPARVAVQGKELFGRVMELGDGMNIFTDFLTLATILLAGVIILIAFFVLALQIFVQLIAFKLGSLAAFVALPWGVFAGTAWAAERPLGWVASSAIRLFLLAFVASVALSFVAELPQTMTLDNGGALDVLLFGLTILALSFLAPALASEVMQGNPSLSAAQPIQGAMAGAGMVVGAAVTTKLMTSGRGGSRGRPARGRGPTGGARPRPNYAVMQPKQKS
ncbi:type IV secretion system protein [Vitreimonas sp.]|uniref:type IV secretion system protein n=1 Tax=Vitreimonas sp. TaxID=3069702 RepID=UPI002EDA86A2